MSKVLNNLIAARALILDIDKWTQGKLRTSDGCHCALGAVAEVAIPEWDGRPTGVYMQEEGVASLIIDEATALAAQIEGRSSASATGKVFSFNDGLTERSAAHARVIKMFDDAIEAERKAAPLRNLIEARALVEKGWYQGSWTSTAEGRWNGNSLGLLRSPAATCFCALGAVGQVCTDYETLDLLGRYSTAPEVKALRDALPADAWTYCVDEYNDAETTTKADILALFDRAIATLSNPPVSEPATSKTYKPAHGGYPGEVR